LNFCALAMILSSVSSKSNDVAFEPRRSAALRSAARLSFATGPAGLC